MIKPLILAVGAVTMVGCVANPQYSEYLNTQATMETARAMAEAERYRAMAEIAKYGDTTTQVAAMMSMQAQGTAKGNNQVSVRPPKSATEEALEWVKVLVNPIANVTINGQNNNTQRHTSDNNRDVSIARAEQETAQTQSTNDTMASMAGEIQAPAANYTDSNNSYADSYNTDSYDQHTDSYNADSYNDQSDNSNNSDNSDNSNNSDNSTQNPPGV